ncbi:DNA polymerase III subunit epsilon, partial [Psychrobacter sp. ENNN9_III]|uniref:DNA polymerase III subunit epsilon n=1 Tax=Psychrobacter sp. ENNN9_III TaxID=1254334 RepID=UPI00071E755C
AGNEKADELANLGVTSSSEHSSTAHSINSFEPIDDDIAKKKDKITANDWLNNDPLGFNMMDNDLDEESYETPLDEMSDNNDSKPLSAKQQPDNATQPVSIDTMISDETNAHSDTTNMSVDLPKFDGDTGRANPNFRPLLPKPIHRHEPNRQLIMDTETTGLDPLKGDRVIEVGIVEMVGRKFTGEKLHVYINPQRGMDEEVIRIHGISEAFLADKPTFDQVAKSLYDFMDGAEIIAHNATFDMNFLSMEFSKVGLTDFAERVQVTDSLLMAKQQYPGQKNTLDALVRRLDVGKQDRTFHGALLDSEILAEVYLAMTGGQVTLAIEEDTQTEGGNTAHANFANLASLLLESTVDNHANQNWFAGLAEDYPELNARLSQW